MTDENKPSFGKVDAKRLARLTNTAPCYAAVAAHVLFDIVATTFEGESITAGEVVAMIPVLALRGDKIAAKDPQHYLAHVDDIITVFVETRDEIKKKLQEQPKKPN